MSTFYQMSETVPHKMSETVPYKITTNNLKKPSDKFSVVIYELL